MSGYGRDWQGSGLLVDFATRSTDGLYSYPVVGVDDLVVVDVDILHSVVAAASDRANGDPVTTGASGTREADVRTY